MVVVDRVLLGWWSWFDAGSSVVMSLIGGDDGVASWENVVWLKRLTIEFP